MFNQKKLMKKTTFQRKQYVIKKLLIFMIVGFVSNLNAQTTLLTVGSSGTVTISSEGTLNISGLELSPSTDFTINQTQVSVDLEATSLNGTPSMERVYSADSDIQDFTGTISYSYADNEMNGLTHDASLFIYDTASSAWMEYPDTDSSENIVTSSFDSPLQINLVTVGAPGSLSVQDPMASGIKIYPNPSSSVINIDYPDDLQLILFNFLGQQLLSSNSKTLNISNLKQGTYILKIKDSKNTINNFKIIKQ